jgi:hypothetical protein
VSGLAFVSVEVIRQCPDVRQQCCTFYPLTKGSIVVTVEAVRDIEKPRWVARSQEEPGDRSGLLPQG